MASSSYLQGKPHVHVGLIGAFGHGKSTLNAAVARRQAFRATGKDKEAYYAAISRGQIGHDENRTFTISLSHLEYESPTRHYIHFDLPGGADFIKNLISDAAQMNCAILVVAADAGIMPQTREHVLLMRQLGVSRILVYLNKIDAALAHDPSGKQIENVEREVRELLDKHDFPGNEIPVIRGSSLSVLQPGGMDGAVSKSIDDLVAALDAYVPLPVREKDKPFLMSIEDVFSIKGRGTVGTGRIERGMVRVGDEVEIVGLGQEKRKTTVLGIEMFQKTLDHAEAGDNVGLFLRGIARTDLSRGQVLAQPGSIEPHTRLEAQVYLMTKDEGGLNQSFPSGHRLQFFFRTTDVTGTATLTADMKTAMPGDTVRMRIELDPGNAIAMEEGLRFALREGGRTVGSGIVLRLEKSDENAGVASHNNQLLDSINTSPVISTTLRSREAIQMFDLNSLNESHFTWQTALSLAMASELAYQPAQAVENVATRNWNLDECAYLVRGRTHCFVACTDSAIIVAFRGTAVVADWLANLDVVSTHTPYGMVHRGFVEAYRVIESALSETIERFGPRDKVIHLTGHSLGAAIATVAAAELRNRFVIAGIYSFGQPRLGARQTEEFFQANYPRKFHRFVFDDDIVTRIPPGYRHVGRLYHFDSNGLLMSSAMEAAGEATSELPPLTEAEFEQLKATAKTVDTTAKLVAGPTEASGDLADRSLEGLFPSVKDHRMARYLFAIRNQIPRPRGPVGESAATRGLEMFDMSAAKGLREPATRYPVQLRVRDLGWKPPTEAVVISQIGPFYSLQATKNEIAILQNDLRVASVNLGRDLDFPRTVECSVSIPFVQADMVHRGSVPEEGDEAIVAIVDTGIDILHEAFLDQDLGLPGVRSRIDAIWVQRDKTGPSPAKAEPQNFTQNFGTLYLAKDINNFVINDLINKKQSTPSLLRDPGKQGSSGGHGTHVASIGAGRAVGTFGGGMAPKARIVVVVPDMKTTPPNPPSLGYSNSHQAALDFLLAYKRSRGLPMVVNVSMGMNAGAHDGMTDLEKVFDTVSTKGKEEGFVIVKSAGNERGFQGHAQVQAAQGGLTTIEWDSDSTPRTQDYLEFWYSSGDDLEFQLIDPSQTPSPKISLANLSPSPYSSQGNDICLTLTPYHPDNNDHLLCVKVIPVDKPIQTGPWVLNIVGKAVGPTNNGTVDGWVERNDDRPVKFTVGSSDKMTLSIPGTADTVISVAASGTSTPLALRTDSSYGPTRKNGPKPDVNAPGGAIIAACSNSVDHQAVMTMGGTSMAAPHVAGAIALVLSARHKKCLLQAGKKQFNAIKIAGMVKRTSKNYNQIHNPGHGYGGLDTLAFFNEAALQP